MAGLGIAGALVLLARVSYAAPTTITLGDGLASVSISSSTVNRSDFSWISSWASTTTGTDDITYTPYLSQQTQTASRSPSSSSIGSGSNDSNSSSNTNSRVVIPVVIAVLVVVLAVGVIMLIRWKRQRALHAHRRRTSWVASNRFKWHPDVKAPFDDAAPEFEPSPPYAPAPAATHQRKTSIL